jgi:hypothetical protein
MAISLNFTLSGGSVGPVFISMGYADPGALWLLLVETANQWSSAPTANTTIDEGPPPVIDSKPMTLIGNIGTGTAGGTASTAIRAYGYRCVGNEESITVPDQGDHQIALAASFSGAKLVGTPWLLGSTAVEASPTTAMSIPGLTTTKPNSWYVGGCALATDTATDQFPTGANADLSAFAKATSLCSTVGNGGGISMYVGKRANVGLVGPTTGIISGASVLAMLSLEILPEPTGRRHVGMRWL